MLRSRCLSAEGMSVVMNIHVTIETRTFDLHAAWLTLDAHPMQCSGETVSHRYNRAAWLTVDRTSAATLGCEHTAGLQS